MTAVQGVPSVALPERPPFALRGPLLTPLPDGSTRWLDDGLLEVDAAGTIASVGPATKTPGAPDVLDVLDVRPLVLLPGFVDCHVHLPQVPAAGMGAGMGLLAWLQRHVFPLERDFDAATAERLVPQVLRAMTAVGTTTIAAYGAIWAESTDASFRALEAHGMRATLGKVMMDRLTYDEALPRDAILEASLRQSADLCERWHGTDGGRLRYAFTPRFAVSCSADMLRESATLARDCGALWQTHVSEDPGELSAVRRHFPEARDYLDVYDRAGALAPNALLAHAIHLSDRELARLAGSGAAVAHCPVSNAFLSSGVMPLVRILGAGIRVGLGSDVAGAPELSIATQMREGFYQQSTRASVLRDAGSSVDRAAVPGPLDWLRLGTLGGAQALGLGDVTGSLEVGKEADLIAVDVSGLGPPGAAPAEDAESVVSRLIFRERHGMVRAAWVRGRRLEASSFDRPEPPG